MSEVDNNSDSSTVGPNASNTPAPVNTDTTATPSNRKNIIDNAVDFLIDPRVVNASDDKKRSFLKSKGMTDEEINEAYALSSKGI